MERLASFFERAIRVCVVSLLALSAVSFFFCWAVYLQKGVVGLSLSDAVWLLPALLLLAGVRYAGRFWRRKSERALCLFGVVFSTFLYIAFILSFDTKPVSDYGMIWQAASEMARGAFADGKDPTKYMYYYNWQTGMAALESVFIRAFGENFLSLKVVNVMIMQTLSLLIYTTAKRKLGRSAAIYAYLLTLFYLPYQLTAPQFTNHHTGIILILLGIMLYEKEKPLLSASAGGLFGLLNVMRPMGIVLLLTAAGFSLYRLMDAKKRLNAALHFGLCLAAYFLVVFSADALFIRIGYTDAPVSSPVIPYYKFVKGLGGAQDLSALAEADYNYDAFNAAQKEQLAELARRPAGTLRFVANKMCRFLGEVDYQFENTFNHDVAVYTRYPIRALMMTSWFQYALAIALALAGYLRCGKQYKPDMLQIFFVLYLFAHIFIEAFSSYRFEIYPFILSMSGYWLASANGKAVRPRQRPAESGTA